MPPKSKEWTCAQCTLVNAGNLKKCKLCKAAKGEKKEETEKEDNKLMLDSQDEEEHGKGKGKGKKGTKRRVVDDSEGSENEAEEKKSPPSSRKKKAKKEETPSNEPSESSSDESMSSHASSSTAAKSTQCKHTFKLKPSHTKDGWKYTCDVCHKESEPKEKVYVCTKKKCDYALCGSCKAGKPKEKKAVNGKEVGDEDVTPTPPTPKVQQEAKEVKEEEEVKEAPQVSPTPAKKETKKDAKKTKEKEKTAPSAAASPTRSPPAKSPSTGTPKPTLGTRLRAKASLSPADGPKGRYNRPTAGLRKPVLRCGLAKPPPRLPED